MEQTAEPAAVASTTEPTAAAAAASSSASAFSFADSEEINLAILHQLLLPVFRYVEAADYHVPISKELLKKYIHIATNEGMKNNVCCCTVSATEDQENEVRLDGVLGSISPKFYAKKMTLWELMGADVAGVAYVTPAELALVQPLFHRDAVTRDDVAAVLMNRNNNSSNKIKNEPDADEKDEKASSTKHDDNNNNSDTQLEATANHLCDALFSKSDTLPGAALHELMLSFTAPPRRIRYVHKFAESMVWSNWKMVTAIPYFLFFILVIVAIVEANFFTRFYSLWRAQRWSLTDDWSNGCTDSNVAGKECFFGVKTAPEIGTDKDATRWMKKEQINQLWTWHGSPNADDMPFAGSWLVGAALARTSLQANFKNRDTTQLTSCDSANITETVEEVLIGQTFSCESVGKSWQIPFNVNQSQTTELLSDFSIAISETADAASIISYATQNPETGFLAYSVGMISIPRANSHNFRAKVRVIAPEFHGIILPMVIYQIILTMIAVIGFFYFQAVIGNSGGFNKAYVVVQIIQLGLIGASYSTLFARLPLLDSHMFSSYVIPGFDTLADRFDFAFNLWAFWLLFFLCQLAIYFSEFDGVGIVFSLLRIAAGDIIGLVIIFGVIFLGFVMGAQAIFGSTVDVFSHLTIAVAHMVTYIFGDADYDVMSSNHPVIGVIFHYIYRIFIVFFFLNLLVAALTAPLDEARESADLHNQMFALLQLKLPMRNKKTGATTTSWLWFLYNNIAVAFVSWIYFAIPFTPSFFFWVKHLTALRTLFCEATEESAKHLPAIVKAAECILAAAKTADERALRDNNPYESLLLAVTEQHDGIPHKTTLLMMKLLITAETGWQNIRDARLIKALLAYDANSTKHLQQEKHFEDQKETRAEQLAVLEQSSGKKRGEGEPRGEGKEEEEEEEEKPSLLAANFETVPAGDDSHCELEPDIVELLRKRAAAAANSSVEMHEKPKSTAVVVSAAAAATADSKQEEGSDENNNNNNNNNNKESGNHTISTKARFHFTGFVLNRVRRRLFYPLYTVLALICYIIFATDVLPSRQYDSYMSTNCHKGLRDNQYLQKCDDAGCKAGFTHGKTLKDVGHLPDLFQMIDLLIKPQLFDDTPSQFFLDHWAPKNEKLEDGRADPEYSYPVGWSTYTRRKGNVTVRQLRSVTTPCKLPKIDNVASLDSASQEKYQRMKDLVCVDSDTFDTKPFARPDDSLFPQSAYEFQAGKCAEILKTPVLGQSHSYPCEGYMVDIEDNQSQVDYLKTWITNATRFLSISAIFDVDDSVSTQYTIYFESSHAGGTGWTWVLSEPTRVHQTLHNFAPAGYTLLAVTIVRALFAWIVVLLCGGGTRTGKIEMFLGTAYVPMLEIILALVIFSIGVGVPNSLGSTIFWAESVNTAIIALYLTSILLQAVLFPFAELFSRRATTMISVFSLALRACMQVLPLFLVCFVAFTFSGHVLWGRWIAEFSGVRLSAATVGRGFLGDWDLGTLFSEDPVMALVYTTFFSVMVLIVLANLVLSLVTGAAEEAQSKATATDVLSQIARARGVSFVPAGPFFEGWLALHIWWAPAGDGTEIEDNNNNNNNNDADQKEEKKKQNQLEVENLCMEHGRALSVLETLTPFVGAKRTTEVLNVLKYESIGPVWLRCSVASLIIAEAERFRLQQPALYAQDEAVEADS